MSDLDKRCGTCRWWRSEGKPMCSDAEAVGFCMYPQDRLPDAVNMEHMYADEGATCPCWGAKE